MPDVTSPSPTPAAAATATDTAAASPDRTATPTPSVPTADAGATPGPRPTATVGTAPPPTDPTPTADPGTDEAVVPRRAGTYLYDTVGSTSNSFGGSRPLPEVTTLEVEPAAGRTQVSRRDLRDDDGRGSVTTSTSQVGPDVVRLGRLQVTTVISDGFTDEREWVLDPPAVVARPDASPGDEWSFVMDDGDTRVNVTIRVLREETITVAGESLPAVVVRTVSVLTGGIEGEQTTTSWVRRDDLLTLKEEHESSARSGPVRVDTVYRAQLRSLTPR